MAQTDLKLAGNRLSQRDACYRVIDDSDNIMAGYPCLTANGDLMRSAGGTDRIPVPKRLECEGAHRRYRMRETMLSPVPQWAILAQAFPSLGQEMRGWRPAKISLCTCRVRFAAA